MRKSLVVQTAQVLAMPSIKHKSPAKRIRDIRRLLTFMLAKIQHQESVPSTTSQKQDDFLSLQRSIDQDSEKQRGHEEQRRREEREKDMKEFEMLLGMHPT